MKIREVSSQFCAVIMATDPDWGAEAKNSLTAGGYENYLITDHQDLTARLQDKNPHVLIFSIHELEGNLSSFVESILKTNPEIRFIVVCDANYFEAITSYEEYGFEQFVTMQKEGLGGRVRSAMDRICEKLYYIYQNEQLLRDLQQQKKDEPKPTTPQPMPAPVISGPSLSSRVVAYQSATSREVLVQKFFDCLDRMPVVFFRFLPSVVSFVATQAQGFEPKQYQGIGCQLEGLNVKDLSTQLALGVVPAPLLEVVQAAFKIMKPRLQPLYSQGQLEGIFVYDEKQPEEKKNLFAEEYSLFAMAFSNFDLQRRIENLEVQDPVTEIYNRKYYDVKIQEEVERSSRIKQALSLIKVSIDDFFEIEQSIGESGRDLLLKKVAHLITKSARTTDIVARTGQNEISALMPHCHRQGALLRAERIRRIIENSLTLESGMKVSVSIGISEYPTLCNSATHLEETALKALHHISQRGGNKICLSKAPAGHSPEFVVQVEPG